MMLRILDNHDRVLCYTENTISIQQILGTVIQYSSEINPNEWKNVNKCYKVNNIKDILMLKIGNTISIVLYKNYLVQLLD
jgi:hypothetical protein